MQKHVWGSAVAVVGMVCASSFAEIKPVVVSGETDASGVPVHLGVPLEVGEVLVVTSWSAVFSSLGSAKQVDLASSTSGVDTMGASAHWSSQHHFSPGIVFRRDGAGLSDSFVSSSLALPVSLHGYTAREGEWFGVCAPPPPPAAAAISPLGLAILAVLLAGMGLLAVRRGRAAA